MPRKKRTESKQTETPRFPDFQEALHMLEERLAEANTPDQNQLFTKWHTQLTKIQQEVSHFQKLETFSKNLKRKPENHD